MLYVINLGWKGKLVMMFIFDFKMLLSGMVHLLGGGVYLNCMNVKFQIYCELGYEELLCELRWKLCYSI